MSSDDNPVTVREFNKLDAKVDRIETRMYAALFAGFSGLGLFVLDLTRGSDATTVQGVIWLSTFFS